jgi:16S rRNA (guanine966-N2)-methyltransferase
LSVARNLSKPVILSEAKNLAGTTKILRFAQNDKFANQNCRIQSIPASPQRHSHPMARRKVNPSTSEIAGVRIIGGRFRGRKLLYSGDLRTRPMKDRLREAVFNLLGDAVAGTHALDLFAGTGALGLEALSRGAARATFFEQHFPTAELICQNIASLDVEDRTAVIPGNVFLQSRTADLAPQPWIVFCSPPYEFYLTRSMEMMELLAELHRQASLGSVLVVEADARFDFSLLPDPAAWDVRPYPPAVVGVYRKGLGN